MIAKKKTNANDHLGVPSPAESVAQPLAVQDGSLPPSAFRTVNTAWAGAMAIALLSVWCSLRPIWVSNDGSQLERRSG